jgi:transglutaminase-like putative cysteine protease
MKRFVHVSRFILVVSALLLPACILIKPPSPFDWGRWPRGIAGGEILSRNTRAAARVLFDIGDTKIASGNFDMVLTRHVRIQILSEAGEKYTNIRIPFWHDERVSQIKAQTMLPNGKIIKLRKEDIYEEGEKKGWRCKVFAIPGVEKNCIVEYQYRLYSPHIALLEPWFFQRDLPTKYSRISIEIDEGFAFDAFVRNSPDPFFRPIKERIKQPTGGDHWRYTWEFRNLPPIKDVPFMTTPVDYLAALHFQLVEFRNPRMYRVFAMTLGNLRDKIYQSYEPYILVTRDVQKLSGHILGETSSATAIIEKLYNFVRDSVSTSEYTGYVGNQIRSPDDVIHDKMGSRVEKNLLLLSLLRANGIEAKPVIISTRSHGKVDRRAQHFGAFNHVLASVDNGTGEMLFLDTVHSLCPHGLLPPEDLTNHGLIINGGQPHYVDIPQPKTVSMYHARTIQAEIDDEGTLNASTMIRFDGYRNLAYRDRLAGSASEAEFIQDVILKGVTNATIDTFNIYTGDNTAIPLTINVSFTVKNFAYVIGDKIYFSPALFHKHTENTFQLERRSYPIEYPYPQMNSESVVFKLPADYRVQDMPAKSSYALDGQDFERLVYLKDHSLHYARHHRIQDTYYPAYKYQRLKDFYTHMVQADRDQVVLSKSP